MSGFKLLAIRPLLGCSDAFTKVLTKGTIYRLHNDYVYEDTNGVEVQNDSELDTIKDCSGQSSNLFDLKHSDGETKCHINISAILGKNGSGKSSLIDLLLLAKFQLGCTFELLEKELDSHESAGKCDSCGQELQKKPQEKTKTNYTISDVKGKFSAEFYFVRDNIFYILKFDDQKTYFDEFKLDNNTISGLNGYAPTKLCRNDKHLLSELFYSIILNYSIYGLNSSHIGDWINPLFHKNDGYRTPIVLNPMRENGDFDVNREEYLNKQRLLSNLVFRNAKKATDNSLTDELKVLKIKFLFDKKAFDERNKSRNGFLAYYSISQEQYDFIFTAFEVFLKGKKIHVHDLFHGYLKTYLVDKSIKIAQKYPEYRLLNLLQSNSSAAWNDFFVILINNNSHTTFKFRQAYNFISSGILNKYTAQGGTENNRDWNKLQTPEEKDAEIYLYEISLKELTRLVLKAAKKNFQDIIYFLPPAIFSSDLVIYKLDDLESTFSLSSLSSGESQLIGALQTCYYHILNLESIHWSESKIIGTKNETIEPVLYQSVNIVFDEIELYFHPEYQRQFISKLVIGIDLLPLNKIRQLNIIFSTHSPFILSDIPVSNILRLEVNNMGKSFPSRDITETFGANIHDLLANDFFLDKGFMGEFAKNKINEVIQFLTFEANLKEINKLEKKGSGGNLENYEKSKLNYLTQLNKKINKNNSLRNMNKKEAQKIIKIIGEPLIEQKLRQMLNSI